MYAAIIVIAIVVIAIQIQMASLKTKIEELHSENETLRTSLKSTEDQLSTSISNIEDSIDALEIRAERLENEDVHGFADDISFLKTWVKNVGQIATSTRDKINPSVEN
ncbi:hypothetical protein [Leclercia sp. W17]|uniref:hypothetical protein n=1 Tax=Leclercia sp. W17 TaxID=2282309 RepID=UPI000DF46994|nr:hypothetical protein [Leclercia sp. W17]AXF66060.1 hypothetical protein DVA44_19135 [Leclercia sp. W17]